MWTDCTATFCSKSPSKSVVSYYVVLGPWTLCHLPTVPNWMQTSGLCCDISQREWRLLSFALTSFSCPFPTLFDRNVHCILNARKVCFPDLFSSYFHFSGLENKIEKFLLWKNLLHFFTDSRSHWTAPPFIIFLKDKVTRNGICTSPQTFLETLELNSF